MKKRLYKEKGLLSLEACIAVTIFIFVMLFMYSFFVVFEVRNAMAHATLATTNSLALDAYANENVGNSNTIGGILYNLYGEMTNDANGFTDYRNWYENTTVTEENGNVSLSTTFSEVIKTRFISYLTSGDVDNVDQILEGYHIQGGIDGLDFSNSYISDDKLYIVVRYSIEYEYNVFNLGTFKFEQSACSKIWK